MVRRNWIKGKPRKRNKTYSERFIDRAMNDGVQRSAVQILHRILDYNDENGLTYNYVPSKGKIIHYVNDANRYKKIVSTGAHEYVKLYLCGTCDGSGFLGNNNCKECNSEEEE
jgi:hypothetical protein|tara:strand:- start:28 stop:366 length:339 start_codon:yes stop_codon:yes gene_type:complete